MATPMTPAQMLKALRAEGVTIKEWSGWRDRCRCHSGSHEKGIGPTGPMPFPGLQVWCRPAKPVGKLAHPHSGRTEAPPINPVNRVNPVRASVNRAIPRSGGPAHSPVLELF